MKSFTLEKMSVTFQFSIQLKMVYLLRLAINSNQQNKRDFGTNCRTF